MVRFAATGAAAGAVVLAVLLATWEATQPHGALRLSLGAATFLLAPPYILLGAAPYVPRNHFAFYALAIAGNAGLYGACALWLYSARRRRLPARIGPILALFAVWVGYLVVHG
jgi:hypothetical protein